MNLNIDLKFGHDYVAPDELVVKAAASADHFKLNVLDDKLKIWYSKGDNFHTTPMSASPERFSQTPPPIPKKRKGPPPIPGRKGPPPIPKQSPHEKMLSHIDAETERLDAEHAEDIDVSEFMTEDVVETGPRDISHEVLTPAIAKMREWQLSNEGVASKLEMGDGISIGFDMRLDRDKKDRANGEPGEDMLLVEKTTGVAGVFDGLGGEGVKGAGAEASAVAAQEFPTAFALATIEASGAPEHLVKDFLDGHLGRAQAADRPRLAKEFGELPKGVQTEAIAMRKALKDINPKVIESGGKTTATLGKTVESADGRTYEVIANIGDGGAFKIKADGTVEELTKEDSAVNYLLETGRITSEQAKNPDFEVIPAKKIRDVSKEKVARYLDEGRITAEEAANPDFEINPAQTIRDLRVANTRTLGMEKGQEKQGGISFEPAITVTEVEPGDKIVFLTDGLRDLDIFNTDNAFDPKKVEALLKEAGDTENLATTLNELAVAHESSLKKAGAKAKMDEKTVLVKSYASSRKKTASQSPASSAQTMAAKDGPEARSGKEKKKGFFSRLLGK